MLLHGEEPPVRADELACSEPHTLLLSIDQGTIRSSAWSPRPATRRKRCIASVSANSIQGAGAGRVALSERSGTSTGGRWLSAAIQPGFRQRAAQWPHQQRHNHCGRRVSVEKMLLAGLSALLCAGAYAGERDNAAVAAHSVAHWERSSAMITNGRNGAVVGAAIGGATGAAIGSDYGRRNNRQVEVRERSALSTLLRLRRRFSRTTADMSAAIATAGIATMITGVIATGTIAITAFTTMTERGRC